MNFDLDKLRKNVRSVVQGSLPEVPWHGWHPARIVQQNADGTLEVRPESEDLAPLNNVPYRSLPGFELKVAQGARVRLCFEEGDRTRPFVTAWDLPLLVELLLSASSLVHVKSPLIKLGGAATQAVPRGTAYRAAESVLFAAVKAGFTAGAGAFTAGATYFANAAIVWPLVAPLVSAAAAAVPGAPAAVAAIPLSATAAAGACTAAAGACTAAATAVDTFNAGAGNYLSTTTYTE